MSVESKTASFIRKRGDLVKKAKESKLLYFHNIFETALLRKQAPLMLEQVLHSLSFNIMIGGKR
jgi:hypothetical protein